MNSALQKSFKAQRKIFLIINKQFIDAQLKGEEEIQKELKFLLMRLK